MNPRYIDTKGLTCTSCQPIVLSTKPAETFDFTGAVYPVNYWVDSGDDSTIRTVEVDTFSNAVLLFLAASGLILFYLDKAELTKRRE